MAGVKPPERLAAAAESDLAGALHEVSNALTVVLGWLHDARSRVPPGGLRDALNVAYAHARRGHAVARRAIGAEVAAEDAVRSARSVATDAILATEPEAAKKGVTVRRVEFDDDAMIDGAGSALQVLVNLLLNAVAFSPRGSEIVLTLRLDGADVRYGVADQGPGVPEAVRQRLFSGRTSLRPGGAGIGLAHSRALAQKHDADLQLLPSVAGASFELRWPTCEAPSRTVQRPPSQASLKGLRVLVIEDDEAVLSMVQFGLEGRGMEVRAVRTWADLERVCQAGERFDAALLDLSPVEADPRSAMQLLRRRQPQLPIILISGSAVMTEHELPFSGWVQKPFELNELFSALEDLVVPSSATTKLMPIDEATHRSA